MAAGQRWLLAPARASRKGIAKFELENHGVNKGGAVNHDQIGILFDDLILSVPRRAQRLLMERNRQTSQSVAEVVSVGSAVLPGLGIVDALRRGRIHQDHHSQK